MKLDATVTVFTVSPLADPCRGGRWASIQIYADQGTVNVRQLCEMKSRLLTAEGSDPSAELQELIRATLAVARGLVKAGRIDTIAIHADGASNVVELTTRVERRAQPDAMPQIPTLPTRVVPLPEE